MTIIGWGAEVEGVMNDPEGFLSLYPDIDLEFVITDRNSLVQRASVMAAGGIAPDLIWTDDGVIVELGTLGIVEPLAPYVERYGMDLSDYAPTISGEYGGELLALPGYALWNFDYTAQVTPAGKAGQIPKFITNGWAISKDSNHKEAAWKFIEWYMSPEQQFDMVTKDMMPAYIPAVYELFAHGHSRDIMEAFLRTFELAALGKPVPQNTAEVLAFNVVTGAMSQVLNGINPSAADALNSVKDQVRATLAGNHQ